MSLPASTRLGPYETVSPLGAGGMGEVCLARDTRLDRTVGLSHADAICSYDADLDVVAGLRRLEPPDVA